MMFATSAFARGYGMAGCGLGSIVLGDKKGMMQIFAATGALAIVIALLLKAEDKKKGYGLELPKMES